MVRKLAEIRRLADELNQALYACKPAERPVIHSSADAAQLFSPLIAYLDHEELWVMNLDTHNRVLSLNKLYQGNANQAQVRFGEIFK